MTAGAAPANGRGRTVLDMNRYQWTVLFAAWLGWGFDVFDGLLFNYVAPNAVPTLLGLPIGSAAAKAATLKWGGILTSLLLVGWGAGGILFGQVADRIGRTRTLLLTMLLYALGTASCAFAQSMWMLVGFRIVASLGIGGEWAAGAAMVAEVVPENRRVEAVLFKGSPETSWRYVFLCGLIPAAVAFIVRLFVKEPERWREAAAAGATRPRIAELFTPENRLLTRSGFAMAVVALISWWAINAFIPIVSSGLAQTTAKAAGFDRAATLALVESWKARATNVFNLGGLIGTLLTIPAAKVMGRRKMFAIYYALGAVAVFATFGLNLAPQAKLDMYFFIGLTIFGVFGSFTYYLPELFPTRLRGTGAGFCYNVGRFIAAFGPFVVGTVAARGTDALTTAMSLLFWVGVVPLAGVLLTPIVVETKDRALA
jgi:MFS family permease